jgi:methyl-accepting chemotaxis protein
MFNFSKKATKNNDSFNSEMGKTDDFENLRKKVKKMELKMAQLEGINSAMPDPYYVRDMDYNIVLWPESIAKLTGYSEAEARKMKCYDVFKAVVCPPGNACPTQHCINVKQFLRDVAVDVYNKSGDTVHSLVSNAGVYGSDGAPIGAVEIVKDNTVVQNTMNSIGQTIKKIDSLSDTLNAAMEKVNNTSQRVNGNAAESLDEVKDGVQTGIRVTEKTGESSNYAGSVQTNMRNINDSMNFSLEKIATLKQKSETIIEFIKIIQDISSKTNLLAINASIEAAHAGEAGRGFKVVADGIRELSKISHDSAMSINSAVQEINSLISETTTSFDVTGKDITAGTNTISELLKFVNDIGVAVRDLMQIINSIENTSITTSQLIGEQNESVRAVSNVGLEFNEIAKKLTVEFDRVFKAIQHQDMG